MVAGDNVAMSLVETLTRALGPDAVLTRPDEMVPYLKEWRGRYQGACLAVVLPASTADISAVMRHCHAAGVAVVPQGGNTGLCGGAVSRPGDILLNLERLTQIRAVDAVNDVMIAEAGCTLARVQDAAAEQGRFFAVDIVPRERAQIGGLVATNAGGTNVLKYGNMREQVLGLEVVLPNGEIWDGLRGLRKDNSGYDLKQLLIGAEGTLGIVTAAVLKLHARPSARVTALLGVDSIDAALDLLGCLKSTFPDLCAAELMPLLAMQLVERHADIQPLPSGLSHDWYLLIEIELFTGDTPDATVARLRQTLAERSEAALQIVGASAGSRGLWAWRKQIPGAQTAEGVSLKHDVSVPLSAIPALINRGLALVEQMLPGSRPCVFGHLGDGNLHFNITEPAVRDTQFQAKGGAFTDALHALVVELDGSFAAEHGIGQLKMAELNRFRSATELALMRSIKQAFDPRGLMNPGKLLDQG